MNNPVSYADPSGLQAKLSCESIFPPTAQTGRVIGEFCGNFTWKVKFDVKNVTKDTGYIIQHLTIAPAITDCNCPPAKLKLACTGTAPLDFWEAWNYPQKDPMRKPDALTDLWICNKGPEKGPCPSMPCKGDLTVRGEARYYEGMTEEQLKSYGFTRNGVNISGENQYSTATLSKKLPGAIGPLVHQLKVSWDCCPGAKKRAKDVTFEKIGCPPPAKKP
jgi:hypothetical protein